MARMTSSSRASSLQGQETGGSGPGRCRAVLEAALRQTPYPSTQPSWRQNPWHNHGSIVEGNNYHIYHKRFYLLMTVVHLGPCTNLERSSCVRCPPAIQTLLGRRREALCICGIRTTCSPLLPHIQPPIYIMVCSVKSSLSLSAAMAFHTRIVKLLEPETIRCPSCEKATELTA